MKAIKIVMIAATVREISVVILGTMGTMEYFDLYIYTFAKYILIPFISKTLSCYGNHIWCVFLCLFLGLFFFPISIFCPGITVHWAENA